MKASVKNQMKNIFFLVSVELKRFSGVLNPTITHGRLGVLEATVEAGDLWCPSAPFDWTT